MHRKEFEVINIKLIILLLISGEVRKGAGRPVTDDLTDNALMMLTI